MMFGVSGFLIEKCIVLFENEYLLCFSLVVMVEIIVLLNG